MIRYRLRLSRTLCDQEFSSHIHITFIIQHSCIYTSLDICTGWFDLDSALRTAFIFFILKVTVRINNSRGHQRKEKSSETRGVFGTIEGAQQLGWIKIIEAIAWLRVFFDHIFSQGL